MELGLVLPSVHTNFAKEDLFESQKPEILHPYPDLNLDTVRYHLTRVPVAAQPEPERALEQGGVELAWQPRANSALDSVAADRAERRPGAQSWTAIGIADGRRSLARVAG
jgi:hypothetical protein